MAAERFTITKFTNPSGEQVWRVEGRMPDGHRVRQNFQDHADAIAKKAELELQALNQPVTLSLKRTRLTDEQLAAVAIGGSISLALCAACFFGLTVPSVLHAFKLDPKIAAGPVTLALTRCGSPSHARGCCPHSGGSGQMRP